MPYSDRMQRNHLYSVFLAPRGQHRMADLGMQIAQQYLSPFDQLIGIVGKAGCGKSMLIKGMFPGLELTNDDSGVNVRPLPILSVEEDSTVFYSPQIYHLDIHFEAAFTPMFQLADAIAEAIKLGKRVVVEHFELVRPHLEYNAHLLVGIGEEVIITRPTLFGPEPTHIAKIVQKSLHNRFMSHTAEDLCRLYLENKVEENYKHDDVRQGFILSFQEKPKISLHELEDYVNEQINLNLPVSFYDNEHIQIGERIVPCTGPRMHVKRTSELKKFTVLKEFVQEPISKRWLIVGKTGDDVQGKIGDLNRIVDM